MIKYLHISSYIRKSFLIYDFATAPIWNFLIYEENFIFFFISAVTYKLLYRILKEGVGGPTGQALESPAATDGMESRPISPYIFS